MYHTHVRYHNISERYKENTRLISGVKTNRPHSCVLDPWFFACCTTNLFLTTWLARLLSPQETEVLLLLPQAGTGHRSTKTNTTTYIDLEFITTFRDDKTYILAKRDEQYFQPVPTKIQISSLPTPQELGVARGTCQDVASWRGVIFRHAY